MNRKQVEQHIRQAIAQSTPDIFEKVSSAYVYKTERTEQPMKNTLVWNRKTKIMGGLAAAFLMLGVIFGGYTVSSYNQVETTIAIDVNPSVEITTNKADKVLSVSPLNEDAVDIIGDMNLKRVDLNVAINAIMGSMVKKGYITDVKNSILVTVKNDDDTKADAIKTSIVSDINQSLQQSNIKATVFNQKVNPDKDLEMLAKKYNLSYGKAVFLYQLTLKDPSLTMEQLAPLTMEQIANLVSDKKIDLHDIVDYDDDDIDDFNDGDRCIGCTEGCICDDCDDYNYHCPKCLTTCKHYTAPASNAPSATTKLACKYCAPSCNCKECKDGDGCDRWCDECPSVCKNAEANKPQSKPDDKPCTFCTSDCTCEECKDSDGCDRWCDDCPSACKNSAANKPGAKPDKKGCKFCASGCTCEDCKEDKGCDRWCDDCPAGCENAQTNKPGNKHSSKYRDDDDKKNEKSKTKSQDTKDDDDDSDRDDD